MEEGKYGSQSDVAALSSSDRDLLEYYKARVDAFDAERESYLDGIKHLNVGANATQTHKLKWSNSKKQEQIEELQKALSDAHMYLYEERDHVLRLSSENDELRTQEMEDRKRIQHLLALTQPVSQEVTYFRDCRPVTISRQYPTSRAERPGGRVSKDDSDASINTTSSSNNVSTSSVDERRNSPRRVVIGDTGAKPKRVPVKKAASGNTSRSFSHQEQRQKAKASSGGPQIVRTIYMPNESVSVLKMIIQSLRKQLEETQELNQQRAQALLEDRLIKQNEHQIRIDEMKEDMKGYDDELMRVKDLYQATTRDYLLLRHESQKTEKELRASLAAEREKNAELTQAVNMIEAQAKKHVDSVARNSEEYVDHFRKQTYSSEENLNIIKDQYFTTQELFEKRCTYLENRLTVYKQKFESVEKRRRLETEGYQNDFRTIRSKVALLEKLFVNQFRDPAPKGKENTKRRNQQDVSIHDANKQLVAIKSQLEQIFRHMNDRQAS